MPKQLIPSENYGRSVPLDGDGGPLQLVELDRDMLKIGWDKNRGQVQVAVLQTFDGVLVEHSVEIDLGPDNAVPSPQRIGELTPHYLNLDRDGCNRLIRAVRQARDDAFGKDA